ncbi:MAG: 2-oxoacid:ferredoxin oxidoreductase subunit beta [Flavobacteriales bacterium]|nr:2-oxoacid:ferredoxin oxidoreductase subunit beta [Flavobacteriales bacterium]MCW8911845.1 2-oxoacid:ferredoxin oxidoreductase subunit beta [Flavobacteriales bacterium]MCW8936384.1 2-oxoacid:ferredoxin oxidoreductase subunit beta [Flavobacteriales bacterium]MCW8939981.1 2-oxoacid:ferredoxin oxidoreductase subunit beta [Flavobacteriales bacterium]MCW8967750.1 2-oxoacid:ferredoxin oxidoreductase subunit beta [Flavobacteriales bacterium]
MEATTLQCLYKPRDYASDQEVKWCPGCGDYAIISAVQKTFSELNLKKEDVTIVSGIGCSSRFPYYMNTYGFHTIHGRAAAVATGVKLANPDLSVWMMSGDGDSLAIGGNHFIHAVRRNININLILFNNEIYGLTKGQYSPTSERGKITKSSPYGTVESPFNVGELTLGSKGHFYARVPDTDVKLMTEVMKQAYLHEGFSVVEVLQNCVIFNDKTHADITSKETKLNNQILLEHGKPMLFGENNSKGLLLNGLDLEVVTIGENGISEEDILVHDASAKSNVLHNLLIQMKLPEFPIAMGVIRNADANVYDKAFFEQMENQEQLSKYKSLDDLFMSGNIFTINS